MKNKNDYDEIDYEKIAMLKKNYNNIEIPKELDTMVNKTMQGQKKGNRNKWFKTTGAAAALFIAFIVSINTVPAFADAVSGIPIVGKAAQILNLNLFSIEDEEKHADANIQVPVLESLDNKDLENTINQEYQEYAKSLYEAFSAELNNVPAGEFADRSLTLGYQVVVNNGQLLVLSSIHTETFGSSNEVIQYITIDLENEQVITLPSLFVDDSYIDVISNNIIVQMEASQDPYELEGDNAFTKIDADHNFYINENGKLIICFDQYQVAPGYMGNVSFEIPTNVIQGILVNNVYIK